MSKEIALASAPKELITFDNPKLEMIRATVAKDLSAPEFEFFISVAKARGLDPILGQIHAVKRKDHKTGEYRMTIQVGIDGLRVIANRSNGYAGCDRTLFEYNEKRELVSAEVTVYKIVQGTRCAFTASADWSEYAPAPGPSAFMWDNKPRVMLGKCAEAQALRKAFPNDLSGIYEPAELEAREVNKAVDTLPESKKNEAKEKAISTLISKFARLHVTTKMIVAKYSLASINELTDEQILELNQAGHKIINSPDKILAINDFFKSGEPEYADEF